MSSTAAARRHPATFAGSFTRPCGSVSNTSPTSCDVDDFQHLFVRSAGVVQRADCNQFQRHKIANRQSSVSVRFRRHDDVCSKSASQASALSVTCQRTSYPPVWSPPERELSAKPTSRVSFRFRIKSFNCRLPVSVAADDVAAAAATTAVGQ